MAIIFGITVFLFLVILPVVTITLLIKPRLLKKYLKVKKPHRGKIFATTSLIAIILFIMMGVTAPQETPEQKTIDANAAAIKQQQQIEANKTKDLAATNTKIDKQNAKIANKVAMHNSVIEIGNDKQYTYRMVSNSNVYDARITLLDKNKNKIDSVDVNHTNPDWFIKSKYSPDIVKFISYDISVGSKFYQSKKLLSLSKEIKNYPLIADSVQVQNTQIIKDGDKFTYIFSASSRRYDVKIDFYNDKNQIIYTKDINHADASISVNSIDLKPASMDGTIAYIKTRISIDTKLYDTSDKKTVSTNFDDRDAARVIAQQKADAEAEAARQAAANAAAATKSSTATQIQSPPPSSSSVYYANCTAARAAGVTPIYRGQPGYREALDRDDDGIACE